VDDEDDLLRGGCRSEPRYMCVRVMYVFMKDTYLVSSQFEELRGSRETVMGSISDPQACSGKPEEYAS
jgi:hypothetical protein